MLLILVVAVEGQPDLTLPNTAAEVLASCTASHAARLKIPTFLSSERGLARRDDLQPDSHPGHLAKACLESFEGRSWLSYWVEHYRSRRDFASRLAHVIGQAGITITKTDAELPDDVLKPELGKEKSASKAVSIADAKLMASHIQEAHQLRQKHGVRHFSVLQSEGQQQGLLGLEMLERMNVPQAQWPECDWKWFYFYAKHDDSFTVAAACLQGQIRQSKAAILAPKTNQQGTVLALSFLTEVLGVEQGRDLLRPRGLFRWGYLRRCSSVKC